MNNFEHLHVDEKKCLKDGICTEVCPCGIFMPDETGIAKIVPELAVTCVKCGHCVAACPAFAISLDGKDGKSLEDSPAKVPGFADFSDLVKSRRSIRSFRQDLLDVNDLKKLIELTRWAPTAKNSQALSWVLLNGREKVLKLSEAVIKVFRTDERMASLVSAFDDGHDVIHRNAPHVAVIYGSEKYKWGTFDAAIAINTLELAAKSYGIGSCWGGFTTWAASLNKSVGKSIELADDQTIFAVLMLGKANFRFRKIPDRNELRLKIL